MTTIVEARIVSERWWARDPLHWLAGAAHAALRGVTMLELIRQRIEWHREARRG